MASSQDRFSHSHEKQYYGTVLETLGNASDKTGREKKLNAMNRVISAVSKISTKQSREKPEPHSRVLFFFISSYPNACA